MCYMYDVNPVTGPGLGVGVEVGGLGVGGEGTCMMQAQ